VPAQDERAQAQGEAGYGQNRQGNARPGGGFGGRVAWVYVYLWVGNRGFVGCVEGRVFEEVPTCTDCHGFEDQSGAGKQIPPNAPGRPESSGGVTAQLR